MDKRTEKRINFNVTGTVEYNGSSCSGDIENLSMKGMYLKAPGPLPSGSEVKIKIHLSGASSDLIININGRVARSDNKGMGLTFDRIDLDSYTHLRNIITYNMREQW